MQRILFCILFALVFGEITLPGYDLEGTRNFQESSWNRHTLENFKIDWVKTLCGPVTHTPTVYVLQGKKYVTTSDFGGCVTMFSAETGETLWQRNLTTDYDFPSLIYSRTAPLLHKNSNTLFLGTGNVKNALTQGKGVWLFGVDFTTGDLKWKRSLSNFTWSMITATGILVEDIVYVSTSSNEWIAPINPYYPCCNFTGELFAIYPANGTDAWSSSVRSIPEELTGVGKYSGAAMWHSPVYVEDGDKSFIYVTTGQLVRVPDEVMACLALNPQNSSCIDPQVYYDSVIKIDAKTGQVLAAAQLWTPDVWSASCYFSLPACQVKAVALDYDATAISYSKATRTILAASKSGAVYSFDLELRLRCTHMLVIGSARGGIRYDGALLDDNNLADLGFYIASTNGQLKYFPLLNGSIVNTGPWIKYDGNCNVKWISSPPANFEATGSVSVVNNLVVTYATDRVSTLTWLFVLDERNGNILQSVNLGVKSDVAPSILGKQLFTGTGSGNSVPSVILPHKFYAFTVEK